jgi:hypothetical protein
MPLTITELRVWVADRKEKWWTDREYKGKRIQSRGKPLIITPSGQSALQLKLDVARALAPIMKQLEYYYVIAVIARPDGTEAYRTVVKKTVVVTK